MDKPTIAYQTSDDMVYGTKPKYIRQKLSGCITEIKIYFPQEIPVYKRHLQSNFKQVGRQTHMVKHNIHVHKLEGMNKSNC